MLEALKEKQKLQALNSYQLLRGKAHALFRQTFPNKNKGYAWLKMNSRKLHYSEMTKSELHEIINKLQTYALNASNRQHAKQ